MLCRAIKDQELLVLLVLLLVLLDCQGSEFKEGKKEGKLAKLSGLVSEGSRGIQGAKGAGAEGLRAPPATYTHSHTLTGLPPPSPALSGLLARLGPPGFSLQA
jgi:hypothetical protein